MIVLYIPPLKLDYGIVKIINNWFIGLNDINCHQKLRRASLCSDKYAKQAVTGNIYNI